ncbi:unnamed protein product [Cyclocybe aegerita]|uniref:Uncharacterized protein n=1 Tax=Cyclocybe aegerita TaxID=1973307 RepID=A0A8S0XS17_CYCAE|nr:unnamed protein product [Cyclocybe aegerita]
MPIPSKFGGTMNTLYLKPNCVITSRHAAQNLCPKQRPEDLMFSSPPRNNFTWPAIFSSHELKAPKTSISNKATDAANPSHKFDIARQVTIAHDKLDDFDPAPEDMISAPIVQPAPSKAIPFKRSTEGDEEDAPPRKKLRVSMIQKAKMSKGSKSASNSPNTKEMPPQTESRSAKAVSGRVQCATYALEMLSDNVGASCCQPSPHW